MGAVNEVWVPRLWWWLPQVLAIAIAISLLACGGDRPRTGVIAPTGAASFTLMSFSDPLQLDALPPGWTHNTFWRHGPMDIRFVQKDGRRAVRLATRDSASMLMRQVDVSLDEYPILRWEWLVEYGIRVAHDETTAGGDDHAARIYLTLEDKQGQRRSLQFVWGGQQLKAGDYKQLSYLFDLIGPYAHYVVNGGEENWGRWHSESVDMREIYRTALGAPEGVRLVEVALFCDSDETNDASVAYFSELTVHRQRVSQLRQTGISIEPGAGRPILALSEFARVSGGRVE